MIRVFSCRSEKLWFHFFIIHIVSINLSLELMTDIFMFSLSYFSLYFCLLIKKLRNLENWRGDDYYSQFNLNHDCHELFHLLYIYICMSVHVYIYIIYILYIYIHVLVWAAIVMSLLVLGSEKELLHQNSCDLVINISN